jgi:hypothetical protein
MKKLTMLALISAALVSCHPAPHPIDPVSDQDTARCWTCETTQVSWPCTTIEVDTLCDLTTAQIRAYEASIYSKTDSTELSVSCY